MSGYRIISSDNHISSQRTCGPLKPSPSSGTAPQASSARRMATGGTAITTG